MNFGQIKKALKRLVDRPDMTDAQAAEFIQRAISNLERSPLRLGFQKKLVHATMDGVSNAISIPGDYLELIDLFTDYGTYDLVLLKTWQGLKAHAPRMAYVSMGSSFLVKPLPAQRTLVHLHYYSEAQKVSVDTDENVWITSGTEAVLYTAARMAADDYQIEDGPKWGAQADREIALLEAQDVSEEWAGDLSIELPHTNIC